MQLTTLYRQQDGFVVRVEPGSAAEQRLLSIGFGYDPPEPERPRRGRPRKQITERE